MGFVAREKASDPRRGEWASGVMATRWSTVPPSRRCGLAWSPPAQSIQSDILTDRWSFRTMLAADGGMPQRLGCTTAALEEPRGPVPAKLGSLLAAGCALPARKTSKVRSFSSRRWTCGRQAELVRPTWPAGTMSGCALSPNNCTARARLGRCGESGGVNSAGFGHSG